MPSTGSAPHAKTTVPFQTGKKRCGISQVKRRTTEHPPPSKFMQSDSQSGASRRPGCHYLKRYVSLAMRNVIALLVLVPALAIGVGVTASESVNDFYITITANDLYLCGEGFGGMYGCIDEAISREAKSVVISASSGATVQAVQELLTAVHAVGFDQVGVATFNEDDT
jgi:hypothetical protein